MLLCSAVLLVTSLTGGLTVDITSPLDGATVAGTVQLVGSSTNVGSGRVSISIDGGPFQLATGTDNWSFDWDTTAVTDGLHSVRARAREFVGGPSVIEEIQLDVNNAQGGPTVVIEFPTNGLQTSETLVVVGMSSGATLVELAVDNGAFEPANGLNPWTVVFEPGALAIGPHTLTARATNGALQSTDSVSVEIGDPSPGSQTFAYVSSVDGAPMTSKLWIPAGFDPLGAPTALVVHLHGGGGLGNINPTMQSELDERGWIGIAPDGREWGLAQIGCTWNTSAAYVDNPNPDVGAGEQDIFDAIAWVQQNFPVDPDRIYLAGGSMGGRGTYAIGLKNPDFFAAISPFDPAIDMYEIFARRPEPCVCKEGMVGGRPDDSPFVDTMYSITSGRFLIENAFNLPVFHGHGTLDAVANNNPAVAPFLHGWHITTDASWSAAHTTPVTLAEFGNSCLTDESVLPIVMGFGHTPTLAELAANEPEGYDWAFVFTPVGHTVDPRWQQGTADAPDIFGVPDPNSPGDLLGAYDFFEARTLNHSPEKVVYKTYTDTHRSAFWTEIDITTPWLDLPGAIRAERDSVANALELELVRVAVASIDLDQAGLSLVSPLAIDLSELVESTYDPNLVATGEALSPLLSLQSVSLPSAVSVLRDGLPLAASLVNQTGSSIEIGPLDVTGPTTLLITPAEFPSLCNGDGGDGMGCTNCPCSNNSPMGTIGGCLNSASTSTRLMASGDPSATLPSDITTDLRFELQSAPPLAFCVLVSGNEVAPTNAANPCFGLDSGVPFVQFDGLRCAVQSTQRHGGRAADGMGAIGVTNNPWGGEGAPPAGLVQAAGFTAGQTRYFQVTHRDDPLLGCMRGLNTSQAVEVTMTP